MGLLYSHKIGEGYRVVFKKEIFCDICLGVGGAGRAPVLAPGSVLEDVLAEVFRGVEVLEVLFHKACINGDVGS